MTLTDYLIVGAMGLVLILCFVFLVNRAMALFNNDGED